MMLYIKIKRITPLLCFYVKDKKKKKGHKNITPVSIKGQKIRMWQLGHFSRKNE